MNYEDWLKSVPEELTKDPLWRMEVYRLSVFAADVAWHGVSRLVKDRRTISMADQLSRAVGSVSANVAEGYGRQSGKDQARFYEYSLGSAREARTWYYQARHVLTGTVSDHRLKLMTQIIRLLLTIIPAERGAMLAEEPEPFRVTAAALLDNPPMPQIVTRRSPQPIRSVTRNT
jgi:four helix bundle protein